MNIRIQRKYIIVAFIIYIFITLLVMGMHTYYTPEETWVDKNFYISFIASSWEDIMFFGLVGLAMSLVSLRDPKKDEIKTRLENLFTFEDGLESKVRDGISKTIERLAIYSPRNVVRIYIDEFDEKLNAFKFIIYQEIDLKNLIHDLDYEFERAVDFTLDEIDALDGAPFGRVNSIKFSQNNSTPDVVSQNMKITENKLSYTINEKIPRGGCGRTSLDFWLWQLNGEDFMYASHHTTSSLQIILINRLEGKSPSVVYAGGTAHELAKDEEYNLFEKDTIFLKQDDSISFKVSI